MIRGLIFDFDGLILETESPIYQSYQELFEANQCQITPETWAAMIGTAEAPFDPFDLLEEQMGRPLDRRSAAESRLRRELELVDAQPILPGVHAYLEDARRLGLKTAIASSSPRSWVAGHLERIGLLAAFDAINTGDDVPLTKPDPALYRLALQSLGLEPQEAIAFEDSPNGIIAARRAGIFVVAVPNELTRSLEGIQQANLTLDSLAALPLENLIRTVEKDGRGPA